MTHLQQKRYLRQAIEKYLEHLSLAEPEESEFDILHLADFIETGAFGGRWHDVYVQQQWNEKLESFKNILTLN